MGKRYKVRITLLFVLMISFSAFSQDNFFTDIREGSIARSNGKRIILPEKYRGVSLDKTGIRDFLRSLPLEEKAGNRNIAPILLLPMPDGSTAGFRVWESPVMEPGLAAKYPTIKTFAGQGIDDPAATIRFDWTESGFHAMILSDTGGDVFIDPYQQADQDHYSVYYKKDLRQTTNFSCLVKDGQLPPPTNIDFALREGAGPCSGTELRTYRLALACTIEYAAAVSSPSAPTKPLVLSAMTTSINRVTGVYEKEVAVRLVLINNDDNLIYLSGTDPYSNNDGETMLSQNQQNIDAVIGPANYDIGHVFSTGGGGIAGLAVTCGSGRARGVTGLSNPTGDGFDIDFVAHEMGHQFGAGHTFNATTGNCGGDNRMASTATEPGSGITIMGYAGICTTNDLAPNSIPTFQAVSFDQISNFVSSASLGGTCAVVTATGNHPPVVNAGSNFTIPVSTPFVLTGTATDPDSGDVLSYSWEQIDLGPAGNWNAPTGNAPLFRSFVPVPAGIRYFPKLSDQLNNTTTIGEILPSYGRNMSFRLTARDNHAGGGGVCSAEMQMTVDAASGPFTVTVPSATGISWPGNSSQIITWNVANTNNAPVSCANVTIELSIDGGNTFPTVLLASTPNDGSEPVILPNVTSTLARIRVKAVGNVFYDLSNNNFAIITPVPTFDFTNPAAISIPCNGPATANATLGTTSVLGYTVPVTLSAMNPPAGTSVTFGTNPVTPGNTTVVTLHNSNSLPVGSYTVTIKGISGSITRTRVLTFNVPLGAGPVITTAPQSEQVCSGSSITFSVQSTSMISGYQWQQSTNAGNTFLSISGADESSLEITDAVTSQNNYQYRVLLTGQCNVTTSPVATLTVYALPKVELTAAPYTSLLPGQVTTLTGAITPGSTPSIDATWYKDNVSIGAVVDNALPVNVVSGTGSYQVKLLDVNGCTSESGSVSITALASTRLFIYPSPTDGEFTVAYYNPGGTATKQSVTIFDARGARIYTRLFDVTGPYQLLPIDLRREAGGVYFVVVGDANGKKIVEGKVMIR